MNPLQDASNIQAFLDGFSSKDRRRGKHCHLNGEVTKVRCTETQRQFTAEVTGSRVYTVVYIYDKAGKSWSALCNCDTRYFCKHAYAGMLELQAKGDKLGAPAAPPPSAAPTPSRTGGRRKLKAQQAPEIAAPVPQLPPSALSNALISAVGRPLNEKEIALVMKVQDLWTHARTGHSIRVENLRPFGPDLREYSWTDLEVWPSTPSSDLEVWLYVAWFLKQRGLPLPAPLRPVSDLTLIESSIRNWQRQKAIGHWRGRLKQQFPHARPEPIWVDLCVAIGPNRAVLHSKSRTDSEFSAVTATQLRQMAQEHESGALAVLPEAMPLWLALYNPFDQHTPCHLDYEEKQAAKILNRLLRLPASFARLVTMDFAPLAWPAEQLQYKVSEATGPDGDYEISLVLPDGGPPPPVLFTTTGQPTLYLTATAVFRGPAPHGFGTASTLQIPAPAVETTHGVQFFSHLNLDLPPRLASRTRRVPVAITLKCDVRQQRPGEQTEAAFVSVTAAIPGGPNQRFTSWGWDEPLQARLSPRTEKQTTDELITLVDRSSMARAADLMESLSAKWDDYHACWRVRLTKAFPEQFSAWLQSIPPEFDVRLSPELATLRDTPVSGTVRLDIENTDVDWFDLKVNLNVSDTTLSQDELNLLLNARGRFVRLGDKGWRRLQFDLTPEEDERLARLGLDARDFSAETQRLHALQLADEAARKFLPPAQVESIHRRAAELKARVAPAIPAHIGAQLRPYQVEGFHFLAYLTANHFGGVLADDMGLGKTLQTLTWLEWLRQGGEQQTPPAQPLPSLVVCPKSVMDNWRAEAERFCRGLRVRLWRGEPIDALEGARAESDLIVINYAQLRSLSPGIGQLRWQVAILDEAQSIKNPDSQTAQAARALNASHRLALTGTPIENRLLDLWSVFAFAMPGVLGNRAYFCRRFDQQEDPLARRRLASRVRPFLLRRTKSQVATDLPDRVEEDVICEMEGEQKTLYRAELKRARQLLLDVSTQQELNEQRFHFLTSLLRLRQICCHPFLVSEDLEKTESAKLNALIDLLEPLMEGGHKVLVFSQFVSMLDILRKTIKQREWQHFYLAGDSENRGDIVRDFQSAPGSAVFLISLKAGGFGLNLTAASYVILFDPWWNPAVEAQAIDRTHRIGQTSKVMAYRLLIKDSIEQKIRQLQRAKAALAEDVLGEERFSQALTLDDLRYLLAEEP